MNIHNTSRIYIYIDDEKPLIYDLKFHVTNRQLYRFTMYDVTV